MIRNPLLLLLAALVVACSSHQDPPVTRSEAPINACYAPPPVGAIVGFGVNGQPRQWGTDGRAVKPALAGLVYDLGADFFRVEVNNGETDYETPNDDGNPGTFNWAYYDALFATKRFTDLFDYIRYVNSISSTAHVMLAWHGGLPGWFGGSNGNISDGRSYTLPSAEEDEWVETLLAVMVYAVERAPEPRPKFDLVSPFNEPENAPPEGFGWANTAQEVRVLHKLVVAMGAVPELAGVYLVVGDHNTELMSLDRPSLVADSTIAARLAATSFHRYDTAEVIDYKGASPAVFLTEFNSHWRASCYTTIWSYGLEAVTNVVAALQGGATAGLFWSDYDAPHVHQSDEWQTFGLLATHDGALSESQLCGHYLNTQPADSVLDAMTYTQKPTYQAVRHVFKWIRPGAMPVTMTASGGVSAVAYKNADGTFAVAGVNNGATVNSTVTLTTSNPPSYLTPRISVSGNYDVVGTAVPMTNGVGTFSLPGSSVFTLLSSPGDGSGGSGGQGGMGAGASTGGNGGEGAGGSGNGGISAGGNAGASTGGSGAPSGGQSGSSAGGQSGAGAGGMTTGGAGQGGAGMSSGGAGAGGAGAAGAAGAAGSGGSGPVLVAGWAFNEGTGTTTADASGHGHTGTINGATWVTTGCKFGDCLSFAGTSGKNVTVPTATDLNLGAAFTIMAWVKPTTTSGWRPVLIKENGTNLEAYLLYSDPVTQGAYFTDSSNAEKSVTGGSHVSTSAWSHVAMVRNGTSLTYWVNGSQVASTTVSSLPVVTSTGILAIGGHTFWSGEWFSGLLDDVRVESGAETQAGIQAAMGAGL